MDKQAILDEINGQLDARLTRLQTELDDLKSGLSANTKSTAGDKHETSRAMAHNEQERLAVQRDQTIHSKRLTAGIDISQVNTTVAFGSVVKTSMGIFFFSLGMGKITVNNEDIYCLAANTPMGQALLGKKKGDIANFNGSIEILEIY